MNGIDIGLLVALGITGFRGYKSGFMRKTVGIMAVAAGVFVAARGWSSIQPVVARVIQSPEIAKWVSVILLAAIVTVIADWLLQRVRVVFEQGPLGTLNQFAGAGFSLLLACFVIGLILLAVDHYGGESGHEFIDGSALAPSLVELTQYLLGVAQPILPREAMSNPDSFGMKKTPSVAMSCCYYH